jgi:nuclear transcription factor Y, gamma
MPSSNLEDYDIAEFWRRRWEDIEKIVDFEEHVLPMDFIEKIILAENADMRMTIDTPPVMSKVYELFIQELSFRAWKCAMSHGRNIILESDITEAVASTNSYNFLNGVLHNHGEPCSTSMVQASTSNITPQLQVTSHKIIFHVALMSIMVWNTK